MQQISNLLSDSRQSRKEFVLRIIEKILPVFQTNEEWNNLCTEIVYDLRTYHTGNKITAKSLYLKHVGVLAARTSGEQNEEYKNALGVIISGLYYILWHAFNDELKEKKILIGSVPNDMNEVNEEVIDEVYDFALQTPVCNEKWIKDLAKELDLML